MLDKLTPMGYTNGFHYWSGDEPNLKPYRNRTRKIVSLRSQETTYPVSSSSPRRCTREYVARNDKLRAGRAGRSSAAILRYSKHGNLVKGKRSSAQNRLAWTAMALRGVKGRGVDGAYYAQVTWLAWWVTKL